MTVGELDDDTFVLEYVRRKREIQKLASSQRIPGMHYDEVKQELTITLWRAVDTFDPTAGTTLSQWWWLLWVRRKRDLIEAFFTIKNLQARPGILPMDDLAELAECFSPMVDIQDLCPSTDRRERAVWWMLALGFTAQEIKRKLGLTNRPYASILSRWQTDELRAQIGGVHI